jgi:hypothetical protein
VCVRRATHTNAAQTITVHRIPETVRLVTVLRQFITKPKRVLSLNVDAAHSDDYDETTFQTAYKDVDDLKTLCVFMRTHAEDGVENK